MTSRSNKKSSFHFGQFLKLPLALSVSSCLLMACQSTPKAVTPISEAPASTQAQQSIYNPYGTNTQTAQTTQTQPTIQLPNVGTQQNVSTQTTHFPIQPMPTQNTQTQPTHSVQNVSALDNLRYARDMAIVENDQQALEQYGSLWSRLIHGFRIAQPTQNARVEAEKAWFLQNQDYLHRLSARASRYLYHTTAEAERRGIPAELALLPAIESSYDPSANEPSSNATGLWQFIPSTGRIYGLNQSSTYDGRRDVIESTRAAYDFLTSLYNQFGSWELALAAYNAGPGRVQTAIDVNKQRGLPIDYWSLNLPPETMHYVPRFLALTQIIANTPQHRVTLPNIANRLHFRTVPVNLGVTLSDISNATGVSVDELRLLNPGLIAGQIDRTTPNRIVIPNRLSANVDNTIRALVAGGSTGNALAIGTTQRNDYVVASRNFGNNQASENDLRVANALPSTVAKVTANNTIVQEPILSNEEKQLIINQIKNTNPIVPVINQNDGNIQLLAITTGQATLDTIGQSKRLNYAPNTLNTNPVPVKATVSTTTTTASTPTTTEIKPTLPVVNPATLPDTYTVKTGDSLGVIAKRHKMTTDELVQLNKLDKNAILKPGQVLKIKSTANTPAKADSKTASQTTNKATNLAQSASTAKAPTASTAQTNGTQTGKSSTTKPESYVVKNGDTLTGVASRFGLTKEQLASYNNLDKNASLKRNQKLWLVPNKTSGVTQATPASTKVTPIKRGTYTVKDGDTLIGVANRFGTTQADIAALNNFAIGSKLTRGQVINMPVVIPASNETKPVKTTPTATTTASTPATGKVLKNTEDYTVQRGESLIGLAKRFNVSVEDLAKTNNLSTNASLKNGQVIKAPKLTTTYTVQRGDSLIKLAKKYSISVEELAKLNGLKTTDNLAIKQVLTVPNR